VIDLPELSIVGGDMNTNPYAWQENHVPLIATSQIVDTDQAPLLDDYMANLRYENPIASLGTTEVRYGIESRLDAIFVRGLATLDAGVERDVQLSDHWPVWADVRIQP
jgi:endonuclease/exonuclease/phosphatase family metal-dependent hydrolase